MCRAMCMRACVLVYPCALVRCVCVCLRVLCARVGPCVRVYVCASLCVCVLMRVRAGMCMSVVEVTHLFGLTTECT